MKLEADVRPHHILLAAELRDVEIGHVVELLLGDGLLAELVAVSDAGGLYCVLVVVVVVLVAYADLLVVVSVCGLALLVSYDWHTVNTWDTTLAVKHRAVVVKVRILLHVDFKVLSVMKVHLFFWIESVEVLEVRRVEGILEALLKVANDVEVLIIVLSKLLGPAIAGRKLSPHILLVIKVYNLRVTLL